MGSDRSFLAHLHAIRLQDQTWFCARDLGILMGRFLDESRARKVAPDQRKTLWLERYGEAQEEQSRQGEFFGPLAERASKRQCLLQSFP